MKRLFVVFNKGVIVEFEDNTYFWGTYKDNDVPKIFHYVNSGVYESGHENNKLDSRNIIFKSKCR